MTRPHQPETPQEACAAAHRAFPRWSALEPAARAAALLTLADALDARRADIIATCAEETALTPDELAPEFARMTGTFRLFADTIERGTWHVPAIDRAASLGAPGLVGPGHDLRRTLLPLGPVAVFGASNFPLAYGVCGGDTASALAAGCTVVVKEHPAHPRTGRLLHSIAAASLSVSSASHQPHGSHLLSYVPNEDPNDFSIAQSLVRHRQIAAVGFTGSVKGGLAIDALCRARERPIPAFCEMGSANRVAITHAAAERSGPQIANDLASSILMRHGQQCTKPGIIAVPPTEAGRAIAAALAQRFRAAPPRRMLAPWVRDGYLRREHEVRTLPGVTLLAQSPAGSDDAAAPAVLLHAEYATMANHDAAREEIFGPACIVLENHFDLHDPVYADNALVWSVYFDPDATNQALTDTHLVALNLSECTDSAGRITFNAVPTGVRVAHAMVHSGPFPSCNRPDTTAVGPLALQRWCRPICYQNCPDALLPPELKDANPRGLMRIVNGEYTREPLPAAH